MRILLATYCVLRRREEQRAKAKGESLFTPPFVLLPLTPCLKGGGKTVGTGRQRRIPAPCSKGEERRPYGEKFILDFSSRRRKNPTATGPACSLFSFGAEREGGNKERRVKEKRGKE